MATVGGACVRLPVVTHTPPWQSCASAVLLGCGLLCGGALPHGNFEFVCMVMGMQSAPATFQRLMDKVLAGVDDAKTYIDDTFAFTTDFERQLVALRHVFGSICYT
jgi:hypothetical protein